MDNFGDYYDWGGSYQDGSVTQFMNIQKMLDDLGLNINLTYDGGIHKNLCGVIAAAYIAGIPVEKAVLTFLEVEEEVIKKNEPYDYLPLEDFFQELGYLTNRDGVEEGKILSVDSNPSDGSLKAVIQDPDTEVRYSNTMDGMIVLVNIDTTDQGKCTSDPQSDTVVGHWVALLEYNKESRTTVIYNPYTNRREIYTDNVGGDVENNLSFNQIETNPNEPTYSGSFDTFTDAWWGDILQVRK